MVITKQVKTELAIILFEVGTGQISSISALADALDLFVQELRKQVDANQH